MTHPWWRQYVPLKRRSTIILHGSTSHKTILNVIATGLSVSQRSSGVHTDRDTPRKPGFISLQTASSFCHFNWVMNSRYSPPTNLQTVSHEGWSLSVQGNATLLKQAGAAADRVCHVTAVSDCPLFLLLLLFGGGGGYSQHWKMLIYSRKQSDAATLNNGPEIYYETRRRFGAG
jgi:hypothetical protein